MSVVAKTTPPMNGSASKSNLRYMQPSTHRISRPNVPVRQQRADSWQFAGFLAFANVTNRIWRLVKLHPSKPAEDARTFGNGPRIERSCTGVVNALVRPSSARGARDAH